MEDGIEGHTDDGTPLGSEQNEECQIDAISQSWAIISGAGDPSRTKIAIGAMENHLVRREEGIIQLLTLLSIRLL